MTNAKVMVMIDVETLATGGTALCMQGALVGLDLNTDEIFSANIHNMHYAGQPQIDLNRDISWSTLIYWAKQGDRFLQMLTRSDSDDVQELVAALRHLVAQFNYITDNGQLEYELVTRGNFDLPILETLMRRLGIEVPWHFRSVSDLRTLMRHANLDVKDVPELPGMVKHDAYWDCLFQIECYRAAVLRIGSTRSS